VAILDITAEQLGEVCRDVYAPTQYRDAPKTPKGAAGLEERPKAVGWTGDAAARLQATIERERARQGVAS